MNPRVKKQASNVRKIGQVRKFERRATRPKRIAVKDKGTAWWHKVRPALKPNLLKRRRQKIVLQNQRAFIGAAISNIQKKLKQAQSHSRKPIIITITGAYGSGKTTTAEKLLEALKRKGIRPVLIKTDGYLKWPSEAYSFAEHPNYKKPFYTFPGAGYSPRGTDMKALCGDLRALKEGKETNVRTYISNKQKVFLQKVNPKEIDVILAEGAQVSRIPMAKMSSLRLHIYITPALQDYRTLPRNVAHWKGATNPTMRAAALFANVQNVNYRKLIDNRMADADIIFVPDVSRKDIQNMPAEMRALVGNQIEGSLLDVKKRK